MPRGPSYGDGIISIGHILPEGLRLIELCPELIKVGYFDPQRPDESFRAAV